jgi:Mg-chelatase subunit ChlD/capsular polysaccharide biosynthesis protein
VAGETYVLGKLNEAPSIEVDPKEARKLANTGLAVKPSATPGKVALTFGDVVTPDLAVEQLAKEHRFAGAEAATPPATAATTPAQLPSNVYSIDVVGYNGVPVTPPVQSQDPKFGTWSSVPASAGVPIAPATQRVRTAIVLPSTTDAAETAGDKPVTLAMGREPVDAKNNRFYTGTTSDDVGGLRNMYRLTVDANSPETVVERRIDGIVNKADSFEPRSKTSGQTLGGTASGGKGEKANMAMTAASSTSLDGYVDTSAHWNPGSGNANLPKYGFDAAGKADEFNMNSVLVRTDQPLREGAGPTSGGSIAASGGGNLGVGTANVPTYEFKERSLFSPQDKLTAEAKKLETDAKPADAWGLAFGNGVTTQNGTLGLNGGNSFALADANKRDAAAANLGEQPRNGGGGGGFGGGAPNIGGGVRFVNGSTDAEASSRAIAAAVEREARFQREQQQVTIVPPAQNRGVQTDFGDVAQDDGVFRYKATNASQQAQNHGVQSAQDSRLADRTPTKGVDWTGTATLRGFYDDSLAAAKQQQPPITKSGAPDWVGTLDNPAQPKAGGEQMVALNNWYVDASSPAKQPLGTPPPATPAGTTATGRFDGAGFTDPSTAGAVKSRAGVAPSLAGSGGTAPTSGTAPNLALSHRWSYSEPTLSDGSIQQVRTPTVIDGNRIPTALPGEVPVVTGTYFGGINAESKDRVDGLSALTTQTGAKSVDAEHEKAGKDLALLSDLDSDPKLQGNDHSLRLQATNAIMPAQAMHGSESRSVHVVDLKNVDPADVNQVLAGLFPETQKNGSMPLVKRQQSVVQAPSKNANLADASEVLTDNFSIGQLPAQNQRRASETVARGGRTEIALPAGTGTQRDYPNSTKPGPVQATYDPNTGKFVVITDDKTFASVDSVMSVIDKPKEEGKQRAASNGRPVSADEISALQKRVDELRAKYYVVDTDPAGAGPGSTLGPMNVLQLNSIKIQAESDAKKQETQLETLKKLGQTNHDQLRYTLPRVTPDPILSQLLQESQQVDSQLAFQTKSLGTDNPEVKKNVELKAKLDKQIDEQVTANMNAMETDVQTSKAVAANAQRQLDDAKSNNLAVDEKTRPYWEAKAELDRMLRVKEVVDLRKFQEQIESEMQRTPMVTQVTTAQPEQVSEPGLWGRVRQTFGAEPSYSSRSRVKIQQDRPDRPGVQGESVAAAYDPFFTQTESEVIRSERVLDKVVADLKLNDAWGENGAKLSKEEARKRLSDSITLAPVKGTSLMDINVKSSKKGEAADIANAVAKSYADYRQEVWTNQLATAITALKESTAQNETKIAQAQQNVQRQVKVAAQTQTDVAAPKPALPPPVPQPEVLTRENAFSTFSLNVSDVSFKLAGASLDKGTLPEPGAVRAEEFINAFDYRDPEAGPGVPIAFASERAHDPFAQNRDFLRFSVKTAAAGRQANRPLNIVLLLDNSGSMERADRVQIIHEALRVLASQLKPQDRVSVITFSRLARLWVDGIAGNQAGDVLDHVGSLTPEGGTNLEEAMKLAYATALRHYLANGLNRVVMLTDGAANLGNVDPATLKQMVETQRQQGIALDCFGVGWEGFNDDLLEELSRNGDGRYGFINSPEEASTEFAGQLAGALQVAASDVKVQVEFNPKRVSSYRQIGYAKHQLTKEQFRDNTVDAAEIAAAEAGNALYTVETNPAGEGPVATVRVRYRDPGTRSYYEKEWVVPYNGPAAALDQGSAAMRLAAASAAFAEWLAQSPFASEVSPDRLLGILNGVPEAYGADARPKKLETMIRAAKSITGQ